MMGLSAYAVIAGGLFIALWKHPGVALAGVFCMFGLEQWGQATTTFFAQHHTATNFLIGGLLVLALIVQSVKKGFSLLASYPPVGWLILALFLYAFASTQWAARSDLSLDLWASRWPYVVTIVVLSPLVVTESGDIWSAFKSLLVVGGVLAILLLFFVKWEYRLIVFENGLGNPLAIASMGGMVALIAILSDPWPQSKLWFPVKWVLVAICLALIVRSGSRGQLLGLLLVAVICWPISRGLASIKQLVLLGLMVIFLGAATNWALQEFVTHQEYGGNASRWSEKSAQNDVSGRFSNAFLLVRLWYASPETVLLGLGNSASYDPRVLGIYPHFVPLEVLAEEGLIGFGLYAMILYSVFKSAYRCLSRFPPQSTERLLLGGLVGLFLFTLVLSFKQGSLLGNLEPFLLAIVIGRYERILLLRKVVDVSHEESEGMEDNIDTQLIAQPVLLSQEWSSRKR